MIKRRVHFQVSQVHFHAVHRRKGRPSILSVLNILRILLFKYIFVRKKNQTRTYRTFERILKLTFVLLSCHLLSNSDRGWMLCGAIVQTFTFPTGFGRPRRKKVRRVDTAIDEMTLLTKGAFVFWGNITFLAIPSDYFNFEVRWVPVCDLECLKISYHGTNGSSCYKLNPVDCSGGDSQINRA